MFMNPLKTRANENVATSPETPGNNDVFHIVRQGDTLARIAEKYAIPLRDLRNANPQVLNPDIIYSGDRIRIPVVRRDYQILPGDSLATIAAAHKTTVPALIKANHLLNPDVIYPGEHLRIPVSIAREEPVATHPARVEAQADASAAIANAISGIKSLKRSAESFFTTHTDANNQQKITAEDWQRVATRLGVNVASIKAVAHVEAAGSGFLADGRPKVRFEAHIFSRQTQGVFDQDHPAISSAHWDTRLNVGNVGEHNRLKLAMSLHAEAAMKSTSWGSFQIMGFNYRAAGYDNVKSFVAAMQQSEAKQLDAFVCLVLSDPRTHRALQNQDWETFARRYNGPDYAKNSYDSRMAAAYSKFNH